eukprot:c37597_g1_i1 orf=83-262(-)
MVTMPASCGVHEPFQCQKTPKATQSGEIIAKGARFGKEIVTSLSHIFEALQLVPIGIEN